MCIPSIKLQNGIKNQNFKLQSKCNKCRVASIVKNKTYFTEPYKI